MALACYEAVLSVAPDTRIVVLAATAHTTAVEELGCAYVSEIFADRAYNDDATLVDRALPGAVLHDAAIAAPRIVKMIKEGAIIAESGKRIETQIDTVCLHGDTRDAVVMAQNIRMHLDNSGIEVRHFD